MRESQLLKMPVILEVAAKTCFPCFKVNTPFKANQLFLTFILGSLFSLCWQERCACETFSEMSHNHELCQPLFNKESQIIGQKVGLPSPVINKPPLLIWGDEQGGGKPVSFRRSDPIVWMAKQSQTGIYYSLGGTFAHHAPHKACFGTPNSESPAVHRMVSHNAVTFCFLNPP